MRLNQSRDLGHQGLRSNTRTAFVDVQMVFDGLNHLLSTAQLARSGAANLQQVLADRFAIEHGVKRASLNRARR
jgi:hypothetical protein